jgi:hypothetical protein
MEVINTDQIGEANEVQVVTTEAKKKPATQAVSRGAPPSKPKVEQILPPP